MKALIVNVASLLAFAVLVAACGTAAPEKKTAKWIQDPESKEAEEDLETVRIVEAVKAPEYVPGLKHEAQDAFRKGVQLAHEVPPKYEEALTQFEEALDIEPKFMEPYFNIAMVHERERRPDKALATYQRALKANPDSDDAKAFIGKIYLAKAKEKSDLGKAQESEKLMKKGKGLFEEVVAKDYENVPANNALALYWLIRGKTEQAEQHVRQVLIIEPQNVTALNTRGLIFLNKNELEIARWIFEQKVLSLDPNSVEAFTNLGVVYVRRNDLPRAVANFREAVKRDKSNVPARMNLGSIYLNYLNYSAAKAQYEYILELQPKNVEAMIGLATSTYGMLDEAGAIALYEKAMKLDPRRYILLLKLAKLIEKNRGNTVEGMKVAISYYERYVGAAKLPSTDKVARRIPVLKEMIEKGMIGPVKEDGLKEPGTEGEEGGEEPAPADDGTAEPAPAADSGKKEADKEPAAPAKKSEPTPESKPAGDGSKEGDAKEKK